MFPRIGRSLLALIAKRWEAMGFPHAAQLQSVKYEKLNRDFWDESVGARIAGRVAFIRQSRAAPAPSAAEADVYHEFEALRLRRNELFPTLRSWDPMAQ